MRLSMQHGFDLYKDDNDRTSFMWRYFYATITLFVVAPELRRLQDMSSGFSKFQILSALPFLMLIPFFYSVAMNRRYTRLPNLLKVLSCLWIGAFTYGLLLAYLAQNLVAGLFTYLQFVGPLGVGLWIATERLSPQRIYTRCANYLSGLTTLICIYGIIQWMVVPPWDGLWLRDVIKLGSRSFGTPAPFKIRVFSTMNAPGAFGNFVAVVSILGLRQLSIRNVRFVGQFCIWMIALGISLDRSGWVIFAVGLLVYFVLSRRYAQLISLVAIATIGVFTFSSLDPSNPLVATLTDRFSSMNDLQNDESYNARAALYAETLPAIASNPLGSGLGIFGAAARLSAQSGFMDSGVLARLLEMGWPGAAMLYSALLLALTSSIGHFFQAERQQNRGDRDFFALMVAIQVALLVLALSGESHLGLIGVIFWALLGAAAQRTSSVRDIDTFKTNNGRLALHEN